MPNADEQAIFDAARLIDETEERRHYLEKTCGDDPKLLARVEALLSVHHHDRRFLTPTATLAGTGSVTEGPGTIIGPYELLRQIGAGGMGNVFLAEQSAPVRRQVALKLLHSGADSRHVVARFEAERQVLARMDHPNIAKVHDAGTTPAGRPYFVMELVPGVPITRHCDEHRLTLRQRLELFMPVCRAVQHAHQKGIIHRDLKPANVLVAMYDGQPVPKVIDFGVAKAIGDGAAHPTDATEVGSIIGTLEYMSPEQSDPHQYDIDTRSDVYSLGVLLYELLTGTTPLRRQHKKSDGWLQMIQMIREDEPPKPSMHLDTTEELSSIAANRGLEPRKLSGIVRGDLDLIVMKSLEKDRKRRYETANGLARDIERFLSDEPVEACPPSPMYRLTKFARRNRAAVLMVTGVAAALLIGAAAATWQAVVATHAKREALTALGEKERARAEEAEQRQRAEINERNALAAAEAEKIAKQTADQRADETRAVLEFVQSKIFAAARPVGERGGLGHDVKLRDAMKAALPYVEKSFADRPLIEARLRMTLGLSFEYLGESAIAAEQFVKAHSLYAQHRGADHADTLHSMLELGNALFDEGKHEDALRVREQHFALQKARDGSEHPMTLASMSNLANSYERLDRLPEAIKLREEALPIMKAKLPPESFDLLATMGNLASSYRKANRPDDAIRLFEETLAICRAKLPARHSLTLTNMSNLATAYVDKGRLADALTLREETLELRRAKLGPEHPDTLSSLNNLSYSLRSLGRYEEALKFAKEALVRRREKLGGGHPSTLISMESVANCYAALGRQQEAVTQFEEAIAILMQTTGPTVPARLAAMKNGLAWVLITAGDEKARDAKKAVFLAEQAVEAAPKDPNFRGTLGVARYRSGNWPHAIEDLQQAIGLRKADDPANAREGFFVAMAQHQRGEPQEARAWFAKSVAWLEKVKSADAEFQRIRAEAAALLGPE